MDLIRGNIFMMNSKNLWLRVAGTIFGVVAIFHLLRIVTGVFVLIGNCPLPVWVNWMGLIATGFLCFWLWKVSMGKSGAFSPFIRLFKTRSQ